MRAQYRFLHGRKAHRVVHRRRDDDNSRRVAIADTDQAIAVRDRRRGRSPPRKQTAAGGLMSLAGIRSLRCPAHTA
jgi:hypothetical protein